MPTNRFFCVTCGTALTGNTDVITGGIQCHSCASTVPMPMLADAPFFPPQVLGLEVKFLCTVCQSRLGADVRWEGRGVICPVCGDRTRVPRCTGAVRWPRPADMAQNPKAKAISDVKLSSEEIAFLSEPASTSPGAGT